MLTINHVTGEKSGWSNKSNIGFTHTAVTLITVGRLILMPGFWSKHWYMFSEIWLCSLKIFGHWQNRFWSNICFSPLSCKHSRFVRIVQHHRKNGFRFQGARLGWVRCTIMRPNFWEGLIEMHYLQTVGCVVNWKCQWINSEQTLLPCTVLLGLEVISQQNPSVRCESEPGPKT